MFFLCLFLLHKILGFLKDPLCPSFKVFFHRFYLFWLLLNDLTIFSRKIDRSSLNKNVLTLPENRCRDERKEDDYFEKTYGMPYTFKNCQANSQHTIHPNCSFGILKGKKNGECLIP
jgi:hypothetical protein